MRAEALKGHLDGLLLAALAEGPAHGYAVIEMLRARSDGALDLQEGTLYPALHRLEPHGLLESRWATGGPRRRRVYRLTRRGHSALRERRREWVAFARTMDALMGAA
jgi:PadR family transcriptional regulator, regulatory protein PadR